MFQYLICHRFMVIDYQTLKLNLNFFGKLYAFYIILFTMFKSDLNHY